MRVCAFSSRTVKEIVRDPLNIFFALGFPIIMMVLLSLIEKNVQAEGVSVYAIENLAPAITVFGLCFMTTFSAILIAKDRDSAFIQRLYTTPLKPIEFIFGYALPLIPLGVIQGIICYIVALILGLQPTINILYAVLMNIIVSLFFIGEGLLCGCVLGVKQVGGICGALLSNVTALCSGIFFDLHLLGEGFYKAMSYLPFLHLVELERVVLSGDFASIGVHIAWVIGYTAVIIIVASMLFFRQMKRQ